MSAHQLANSDGPCQRQRENSTCKLQNNSVNNPSYEAKPEPGVSDCPRGRDWPARLGGRCIHRRRGRDWGCAGGRGAKCCGHRLPTCAAESCAFQYIRSTFRTVHGASSQLPSQTLGKSTDAHRTDPNPAGQHANDCAGAAGLHTLVHGIGAAKETSCELVFRGPQEFLVQLWRRSRCLEAVTSLGRTNSASRKRSFIW